MKGLVAAVAWTLASSSAMAARPSSARPATDSPAELVDAITIYNPAAHLDDLLSLPAAVRWGSAGPGKKPLFDLAPAELRSTIAASRGFWPEELEVAMPASSFTQLDSLGRTIMLGALCKGARDGGPDAKRDLPRLRGELLRHLRALRLPRLVIRARFHEPAMATMVGRLFMASMRQALASQHLPSIDSSNGLGLRLALGALLDAKAIRPMLAELGWIGGDKDSRSAQLVKAFAAVPLEAWFEVRGADLLVSIGPAWTSGPSVVQPPTTIPAASRLLSARWETVRLRKLTNGLRDLWSTWENTPAGRRTRLDDDLDLIGDLDLAANWATKSGESAATWFWVERGLHGWIEEHKAPPAQPLASGGVAALLPASLVAFDIDSRLNLGERLSERIQQLENRLSARSWKDIRRSDEGPNEAVEKAYYHRFARFRNLIHKRSATLFDGSSALVLGKGASLGTVEMRRAGKPPIKRDGVAVPELAMVGEAKDGQTALKFAADAWAAIADGFAAPLSPPPPPASITTPALSVPDTTVQVFDMSWIERAGRAEFSTTTPRGFKPHIAVRGNTVVISTSLALTEEILRNGKDHLRLPVTQEPLVSWTSAPCTPLARQLRDWLASGKLLFGTAQASSASWQQLDQLNTAAELICSEVSGGTSVTTQAPGGPRTTRIDLPAVNARR